MKVATCMTLDPKTCSTADTLHQAARIMWENDCGSVPIVDADGKLAGLVTDRDICMSAYTRGAALHQVEVVTAMAKEVFTVGPKTSIKDAAQLMSERAVRRLPVVDDNGKLVGMLSIADLVRVAYGSGSSKGAKSPAVSAAVLAVSKPRTVPSVASDKSLLVPAAPKRKAAPKASASKAGQVVLSKRVLARTSKTSKRKR